MEEYYVIVDLEDLSYMKNGDPCKINEADKFETYEKAKKELDLYDKDAIEYYSVAEDLAQQTDNQKVKGFVSASFGNAYQTFGESQKALKSYSDAVKHYTEAESPSKVAQNYTKAADIMIEFSNVSKAKGLLTKAQNFARKTDNNDLLNEINDKLKNLELL